jgi:hypothetical protein
MKRSPKLLLFLMLAITAWAGWSCGDDPVKGCTDKNGLNYNPNATQDNGACYYPRELTQKELDASGTFPVDSVYGTTKDANGQSVPYSHIESITDPSLSFRIISRSNPKTEKVNPGLVSVLKVYRRNPIGGTFDRKVLAVYAIHKQVNGYYSEGRDWEYIEIDPATVSSKNPNGVLPDKNSINRGKLGKCSSCHNRSDDGLFTN